MLVPDRKGHIVPIQSVPVDQGQFTRMMLVSITPKTDRDTGAQYMTKDGLQRKWTAEVVASLASRFDAARSDTEVLAVTVTSADDPRDVVQEGDPVLFEGLSVGVMAPEKTENDRIKGGKLFWTATGVRSRVPVSKS